MFCPRCGSPNNETTKFCRQCGLSLNPVAGYVSSGGTAPLTQPPASSSPLSKVTDGMTPLQKMFLKILLFVFAPGIFAVIGMEPLVEVSAVLMTIGIVWSIFSYTAEKRRRQNRQATQLPSGGHLPQAGPMPQQSFQPQGYHQEWAEQAEWAQPAQPAALSPPPTNPIVAPMPGSITEDETQKFPGKNRS